MGHACGCQKGSAGVLDVRGMLPNLQHPKIFATFDALAPGESFVLVNDHDLEPRFQQFRLERPGAFGWQYLEQGPEVWRVEVGKPPGPIAPERTVGEVARWYPGTLEVMKEMGINHCCGAELTLIEAAASVDLPLETLLQALNAPRNVGA
jgi:regulator of cell morphogenesis and NO signaling